MELACADGRDAASVAGPVVGLRADSFGNYCGRFHVAEQPAEVEERQLQATRVGSEILDQPPVFSRGR